ncbi:MAG: thiamine pyrophosphate-dependent dehydrogenase E1 component subunit alpha [Candidatus Dormibacteria bacterium]
MVVANRDAEAVTGIDADTLRAMYRHMLRARLLDERMWVLNRQGLVRFWVSGMGQEAIQVALGMQVRPGIDWVAPYYRDLALTLVVGMTPRDQLLAALARADDPNTGGRQMPAHYSSRRLRIVSSGSVVATQLLHAAGVALAARIRGEDAVTVVTTGEGATSEGDFHEALNFAAIHHLAVVFVVQNNGLAISVPASQQMATRDVADRAAAYGIPGVVVDGADPVASYRRCAEAVARARAGEGPTLIDAKVPRLTSHSSDDDQRRYRTEEALEADRQHDCIGRYAGRLADLGVLSPEAAEALRAELQVEIDGATAEAEAALEPDPATIELHVLGDA